MAIYSFKNDRAKDILLDMVVNSQDGQPRFQADWAAYYLSLFPSSSELLPRLETYLKEEVVREKRDNPAWVKYLLDDHDELITPFRRPGTPQGKVNGIPFYEWNTLSDPTPKLFRLAMLIHSLKFNEQIPPEELERFNIARRELAIAWSLSDKVIPKGGIKILTTLQKGDEHFEIYLTEYSFPGAAKREFRWENEGNPYPYTLDNPYWQERKTFYERELANPRPAYTENQLEYIREQIKSINNRLK